MHPASTQPICRRANSIADVLARINEHSIQKLDQLLPWNWKPTAAKLAA
jgi:hypothetical protein